MGYLDDIIIFSKTEEEHLQHLEEIFEWLRQAGLKLKLQKCSFFKKHIHYLGHIISDEGIQPLPEKLESIAKIPVPQSKYPWARVTVIEEVIISENNGDQSPGSLKIQHTDPIAKDIEIELPLTNSKMKELQKQDPLVG